MTFNMDQSLGNLMKEAQKMQQKMQDAQKKLSEKVVQGKAGSGLVTVSIELDCAHKVRSLNISSHAFEETPDFLSDLIIAAFNDATRKVEQASKDQIAQLTAGLNIPPDFLNNAQES